MEDSRHIENLIYRYAELIDEGALESVAELFKNASIVSTVHNVSRHGYDEVLEMYRLSCRLHDSGTPLTRHLTTNVIINIDHRRTAASARSYYTVIQATADLPLQPIISGRYTDQFRKIDGTWEFARREMYVDLIGNCSQHLLYETQGLKA